MGGIVKVAMKIDLIKFNLITPSGIDRRKSYTNYNKYNSLQVLKYPKQI